jgi:hypothetical protein
VEVSEGELAVSANANADGRWRPSRRDLDVGGRPETDRAKRRLAVGNPPFGQAIEDPAGDVADRLPGHHHVIHAGKPPGMIGTIADPELASRSRGTLTWTRPRLGEHRLDPGPVPGATAVHPRPDRACGIPGGRPSPRPARPWSAGRPGPPGAPGTVRLTPSAQVRSPPGGPAPHPVAPLFFTLSIRTRYPQGQRHHAVRPAEDG